MSKPIAGPLAAGSSNTVALSIVASGAQRWAAKPSKITALSAIMLGALTLGASVASPTPARAEIEYPWCVVYSGHEGDSGVNCGFVTRQQCLATASGAGGICYENPAYPAAPPHRRKIRRRH